MTFLLLEIKKRFKGFYQFCKIVLANSFFSNYGSFQDCLSYYLFYKYINCLGMINLKVLIDFQIICSETLCLLLCFARYLIIQNH